MHTQLAPFAFKLTICSFIKAVPEELLPSIETHGPVRILHIKAAPKSAGTMCTIDDRSFIKAATGLPRCEGHLFCQGHPPGPVSSIGQTMNNYMTIKRYKHAVCAAYSVVVLYHMQYLFELNGVFYYVC